MVPGVLNAIKPIVDYRDDVDGVDYSQAVFIFLSNTGANIINEHYHDLYVKDGKNREDLQMSDFEMYIQKGAFNEQGWLTRGDGYLVNLSRKLLFSSVFGSIFHFLWKLGTILILFIYFNLECNVELPFRGFFLFAYGMFSLHEFLSNCY